MSEKDPILHELHEQDVAESVELYVVAPVIVDEDVILRDAVKGRDRSYEPDTQTAFERFAA